MATQEDSPGHASGYSVDEDPDGGFTWSAYGRTGSRQGHADSRAEAEGAAQAAERELNRALDSLT